MVYHLSELLENVTVHPILNNLPAAIELNKRYKGAESMLQGYENDMVAIWMSQHVSLYFILLICIRETHTKSLFLLQFDLVQNILKN